MVAAVEGRMVGTDQERDAERQQRRAEGPWSSGKSSNSRARARRTWADTSAWPIPGCGPARPGAPTRPSWELAARATHTSTSGGSSETDENEAAVIPTGSSPSRAVTTVTPLGQRASVSRNRS